MLLKIRFLKGEKMEYPKYPYPEECLYFAIHKNKNSSGKYLELSRGKNQGIYVSENISSLRVFIRDFAPGEESRLALCYSLKDLREIKKMLEKKNNDLSSVKKIPYIGIGTRKLWGYVLENDVRKIRFYLSRNKDDIARYLEKVKGKVLKAAFTIREIDYIISNMEKIQKGESDQYNYVNNLK